MFLSLHSETKSGPCAHAARTIRSEDYDKQHTCFSTSHPSPWLCHPPKMNRRPPNAAWLCPSRPGGNCPLMLDVRSCHSILMGLNSKKSRRSVPAWFDVRSGQTIMNFKYGQAGAQRCAHCLGCIFECLMALSDFECNFLCKEF